MTPPAQDDVDLDAARETLVQLLAGVQNVNHRKLPSGSGRDRVAAQAPVQRELLLLAHLCDKARVEIMETYHGLRSEKEN